MKEPGETMRDLHEGPGSISRLSAQESPFWAPPASGTAAPPRPIPTYALFDSVSVGLATFLGSPIAGGALMAINYRRMGKPSSAIKAFASAVAVTALVITFANKIPAAAGTAVAVGLLLAMKNIAKALQGAAIEQHVRDGGELGSRWIASAVAIGFALLMVGAIAGGFMIQYRMQLGSKVIVGSKDTIYYSGSATNEEARALGGALKTSGFFTDRGATVLLSKGKEGTVLSFLVQDGVWNQPEMVSGFEEVGREVASAVGGFPLKVRLANTARETMKEVTVGEVIIGTKDSLYYFGSATESEAKALGKALQATEFFQDRGVTVMLSKNDDGTAISFVVAEGSWDMPERVAAFEGLVRQSASAVGGLPIQLRLENTNLDVKKIVTVH